MTSDPHPEPRFERFRLVYLSGTTVDAYYCGGVTLEEVHVAVYTHP